MRDIRGHVNKMASVYIYIYIHHSTVILNITNYSFTKLHNGNLISSNNLEFCLRIPLVLAFQSLRHCLNVLHSNLFILQSARLDAWHLCFLPLLVDFLSCFVYINHLNLQYLNNFLIKAHNLLSLLTYQTNQYFKH